MDGAALVMSLDLNNQLGGFCGLGLREGALAIRQVHRLRAQRIIERADGATLQSGTR